MCEDMSLMFERNTSRPSEAIIVFLTYEVAIYDSLGC
jgi:hypothetical protein